jgi:hypothetical protein
VDAERFLECRESTTESSNSTGAAFVSLKDSEQLTQMLWLGLSETVTSAPERFVGVSTHFAPSRQRCSIMAKLSVVSVGLESLKTPPESKQRRHNKCSITSQPPFAAVFKGAPRPMKVVNQPEEKLSTRFRGAAPEVFQNNSVV